MPDKKDSEHALTPDAAASDKGADRGVPEGLDEHDAKGGPNNDRQRSETAGDAGSKT